MWIRASIQSHDKRNCHNCTYNQFPKSSVCVNITYWIVWAICKEIVKKFLFAYVFYIISINKPTHLGIIISALEIIQFCFFIVVVGTISERVDVRNMSCGRDVVSICVLDRQHLTPRVVCISRNGYTWTICYRNNVTLKVLIEIVCSAVVFKSAKRSVKVVQILIGILRTIANIGYDFLNDVSTVKYVLVNLGARLFSDTNTVVVILVGIRTVLLKLSAFFPN